MLLLCHRESKIIRRTLGMDPERVQVSAVWPSLFSCLLGMFSFLCFGSHIFPSYSFLQRIIAFIHSTEKKNISRLHQACGLIQHWLYITYPFHVLNESARWLICCSLRTSHTLSEIESLSHVGQSIAAAAGIIPTAYSFFMSKPWACDYPKRGNCPAHSLDWSRYSVSQTEHKRAA